MNFFTSFPSTHFQQTLFFKFGIFFLCFLTAILHNGNRRVSTALSLRLMGNHPKSLRTLFHRQRYFIFPGTHTLSRATCDKFGQTLRGNRTTGHNVTWENYLEWQKSSANSDSPAVSPEVGAEPLGTSSRLEEQEISTQLTFQQITDLINRGQTHLIPNNKVIPEALHVSIFCVVTLASQC